MNLDITLEQFQVFLLIFFRMSGLLIFAPIFGNRTVPTQSKIGLSLILTVVMLPILPIQMTPISQTIVGLVIDVFRELMIGMILGFASQLVFAGVQLAGQLISVQMGFSLATVMDPQFNNQSPTISQLQNIFALLVFLLMDGHHWLLEGLAHTFEILPIGAFTYTAPVAEGVFHMAGKLFVTAFQVGAPVIVALFLATLALGLISRAVPQLNVFSVSFPIKIAIGFAALMLSLHVSASVLQLLFRQMEKDLSLLIQAMAL